MAKCTSGSRPQRRSARSAAVASARPPPAIVVAIEHTEHNEPIQSNTNHAVADKIGSQKTDKGQPTTDIQCGRAPGLSPWLIAYHYIALCREMSWNYAQYERRSPDRSGGTGSALATRGEGIEGRRRR